LEQSGAGRPEACRGGCGGPKRELTHGKAVVARPNAAGTRSLVSRFGSCASYHLIGWGDHDAERCRL